MALVAILAATLPPSGDDFSGELLRCVLCGDHKIADFIRNIILFVPLGGCLALAGVRWWRIGLAGTALSVAIEYAQLFIPGRDSSVGDVLSNTTGAVVGCGLALMFAHRTQHRGSLSVLQGLVAAGAGVAVIATTGYLLQPNLPASGYFGQWTPSLAHLEWYRGRVLQASLGTIPLPAQRLRESPRVRDALLRGDPLQVRALVGPPVIRLAPLLSIFDEQNEEILLLGPDRDDLVFRYRTRAEAWQLDEPDLRVRSALRGLTQGDTLSITVRRADNHYCVTVNQEQKCHVGHTAGIGWAMLMYPEEAPPWLKTLLRVGWLTGLFLPAGYWANGTAGRLLVALIGGLGLILVPPAVGLLPTPAGEWLGAACGFVTGTSIACQQALLHWWRARGSRAAPVTSPTSSPRHRAILP